MVLSWFMVHGSCFMVHGSDDDDDDDDDDGDDDGMASSLNPPCIRMELLEFFSCILGFYCHDQLPSIH